MQVIKPMHQGIMYRTYVQDKKFYLSVASLSFFPFHNPQALGTEQQMWDTIGGHLSDEMTFDMCMPKVQGEVLVAGKCMAPKDQPQTKLYVDLDLGPVKKRIVVTGDRHWTKGDASSRFLRAIVKDWEPTEPKPFFEKEIGWKNALGGPDFEHNPWGKGHLPVGVDPDIDGQSPLPNVEDPNRMMAGPWAIADPAGYGSIDAAWPQRMSKVGRKYNKQWERERFPEPAVDMDTTYYNLSPPEQQLPGIFWNGDEEFTITNMHPDNPNQRSTLPGVRPRCFALQRGDEGERWSELPLTPETVWLFPNVERGILISRGVLAIDGFYGLDVDTLLLAWELKDGKTRTAEDYRESVRLREDEETSETWSAREDDLSPLEGIPEEEEIFATEESEDDFDAFENIVAEAKGKSDSAMEKAKQILLDVGLDPIEYLPAADLIPMPVISDTPVLKKMSDVGAILEYAEAEERRCDAAIKQVESECRFISPTREEAKAKVEKAAREICEKCGQNYDELVAKSAAKPPSQGSSIEKLTELLENTKKQLSGHPEKVAEVEQALKKAESAKVKLDAALANPALKAMDRETAHYDLEPEALSAEKQQNLRQMVLARLEEGESFENMDLTGIDLSSVPLNGVCFKGANLDSAKFVDADATGADFSEATLARADFTRCKLKAANLAKSGMGKTNFSHALLENANLEETTMDQTLFTDAQCAGAFIKPDLCLNSNFQEANLSGADLSGAEFVETTLEHASFVGAKLQQTSFMTCNLNRSDFSDADLTETSFVEVTARNSNFQGAFMEDANAHLGSDFSHSTFGEIKGDSLNFGETNLSHANFSLANLNKADFSESSLIGATLDRVVARESVFTNADLTEASFVESDLMHSSLQSAHLKDTHFNRAHLFGADFLFAHLENTDLRAAVIKRTPFEEWKE